jgi:hypothetical protein
MNAICAEEHDNTESQEFINHEQRDLTESLNDNKDATPEAVRNTPAKNDATPEALSNTPLAGVYCSQEAMHEDVVHFDVQHSTGLDDIEIVDLHKELKQCGSNKVSIVVVAKYLYPSFFCNLSSSFISSRQTCRNFSRNSICTP